MNTVVCNGLSEKSGYIWEAFQQYRCQPRIAFGKLQDCLESVSHLPLDDRDEELLRLLESKLDYLISEHDTENDPPLWLPTKKGRS